MSLCCGDSTFFLKLVAMRRLTSPEKCHLKFQVVFYHEFELKTVTFQEGADLRDGQPPSLKDSTPCRPKGPLVLFRDINFWLTHPKIFLKRPWAPTYTNFYGGARAEKRDFLV